jgi:hypothetical protein
MMHKTFRTLASAGAILCLAAATGAAQNGSDHIATLTSISPILGMYAPGAAGRDSTLRPVTMNSVSTEARGLCAGSNADRSVCGVLTGGSTGDLGAALTGAGAPAAQVESLMNALSGLGRTPSNAALAAAIQAFNALVRAAPASFINNPPAELGSIRGALVGIRRGV